MHEITQCKAFIFTNICTFSVLVSAIDVPQARVRATYNTGTF